ncbi:hypothetical protein GALMADRAFT_138660 [Galerina marginata CBS 339.88]|uniref:Transmembrane protein n=1 Tax=Galerina marginata (strain CBS 339.88) TaxID=685588 RepID=A0A067T365_GALM3|nr:hypothetical protein GALMADRAFT_138660 [Galerina marginata CBS 339.88]
MTKLKFSLSRLVPEISRCTKFVFYAVALVGLCGGVFIAFMSYLTVKPLKSRAPLEGTFETNVSLMVEALSVDPISRTITMDWYPMFTALNCTNDPPELDIFLTQSLLDPSSPSWTAQAPFLPLYTMNGTEICLDLAETPYPSFRTVTKLLSSSYQTPVLPVSAQSTLQNYPFDEYIAPFTFSTRNTFTGVINAPNITTSFGVAVNFEISLPTAFVYEKSVNRLHVSRLEIAFRIKRSKATKIFVVMVAITNWLTAAVFLIMSSATLVYSAHEIYAEMFVLPLGAVFAFTSIRANFPGAPSGFGTTLDTYSTLPVLVIMSFCSSSLILLILYRRIQRQNVEGRAHKGLKDHHLDNLHNCCHTSRRTLNEIQHGSGYGSTLGPRVRGARGQNLGSSLGMAAGVEVFFGHGKDGRKEFVRTKEGSKDGESSNKGTDTMDEDEVETCGDVGEVGISGLP